MSGPGGGPTEGSQGRVEGGEGTGGEGPGRRRRGKVWEGRRYWKGGGRPLLLQLLLTAGELWQVAAVEVTAASALLPLPGVEEAGGSAWDPWGGVGGVDATQTCTARVSLMQSGGAARWLTV